MAFEFILKNNDLDMVNILFVQEGIFEKITKN